MDSQIEHKLICGVCQKKFSTVSAKNRHMKNFHDEPGHERTSKHILCPLCPEERKELLGCLEDLDIHLTQVHSVDINESFLHFRNLEEFEAWRSLENREVDYVCNRTRKGPNGVCDINYNCNRSDSKGFVSTCEKRSMKCGGTIRIAGMCPSRILVRVLENGSVTAKFIETHVGHCDELRTKKLCKREEAIIVGQLTAGVTNDRIIQDARRIKNSKLERINIIIRVDLAYLVRKFNIDKKRDADDMIATALKIEEWNKQGKNHAFLFKKIGESYPGLKDENFAVGYMNDIMEKKLKDFKKIICIDGTHGTNIRNWDLTIVLVKDEKNTGFPVAFLLSNRLDQTIQTVFFRALKARLGENIDAEFIMSDDDVKYYNAWIQVMANERKPRRLLCTWHVIKNWNIQGRSKIKKLENRHDMKKQMKRILKETDIAKFMELKENYFKHLEEEGEIDFFKYLQKNYFQSDERIMMWAHCHRINAGINTNMAIESLNKVLKYNKMNGQRHIRVEKLLDFLEELVDDKIWKKIINTERPNANNYQHKITHEAHKKAEHQLKSKVKSLEFVYYDQLCDEHCRAVYCNKCKICIHRYKCDCPEYAVKAAMCKHIHAVVLFEGRSESVLGPTSSAEDTVDVSYVHEPTRSQINYQDELQSYIEDKNQNTNTFINFEERREIEFQEVSTYCKTLDEKSHDKFMNLFRQFKNNLERNNNELCRKRKIETQLYYPNKK